MFGKERVLVIVLVALALGTVISALSTSIGPMLVGRGHPGHRRRGLPARHRHRARRVPEDARRDRHRSDLGDLAVGGGFGIVAAGPIVAAPRLSLPVLDPARRRACSRSSRPGCSCPSRRCAARARVNWLGASLLSGWLVAILLGFSEAPTWGWLSPRVIGLFAVGLVLLAAWVRAESRSASRSWT